MSLRSLIVGDFLRLLGLSRGARGCPCASPSARSITEPPCLPVFERRLRPRKYLPDLLFRCRTMSNTLSHSDPLDIAVALAFGRACRIGSLCSELHLSGTRIANIPFSRSNYLTLSLASNSYYLRTRSDSVRRDCNHRLQITLRANKVLLQSNRQTKSDVSS